VRAACKQAGVPLGKVEAKHLLVNEYLNKGADLTYGACDVTMAVEVSSDGSVSLETIGYSDHREEWQPNGYQATLVSVYEVERDSDFGAHFIPIYIQVGI